MIITVNQRPMIRYEPKYIGRLINIAIDSSKSNTGIAIGDEVCNILDVVEINGTQDGTKEEDTLALCKAQRDFLKVFLRGSRINIVGIENIITKKQEEGKQTGMTIHMSRFKITAVFMSFISFFQDEFGITPELINNWSWKSAVLPEEFRETSVHKGSKLYLKSIRHRYADYSDDVTDAICILSFIKSKHGITNAYGIVEKEMRVNNGDFAFIDDETVKKYKAIQYKYNSDLSIEENVTFVLNRLQSGTYGQICVGVENLSAEELFSRCRGHFNKPVDVVNVLVWRT